MAENNDSATKSPERRFKHIFRRGDMDLEKCLVVSEGVDFDLTIGIGMMPRGAVTKLRGIDDINRDWSIVQFCTISGGGGKSTHTRQAIYNLMMAMKKDNDEDSKQRRGILGGFS